MEIKKVVVGELETNCYLLIIDNECLVIDPGDDYNKIIKEIGNLKVVGCLVTHFHPDHIGALEEVISKYDLNINEVKSKKFKFEVLNTSGHTRDSKCFYFKNNNILFCGDFLFKDGIGRTDLGGSLRDMLDSLDYIEKYPDNTILMPGHGDSSILGDEKKKFKYYRDQIKKQII